MLGEKVIIDCMNPYYGIADIMEYHESDDEIRFQARTPIVDPQTATFRSRAEIFNELAIGHRLSLLVGRRKYGIPEDFSFAIKSIETAMHIMDVVHEYNLSLRFEVIAKRHGIITDIRSTLVIKYGVEARKITLSFNIMPPYLANFVRRSRKFMDFSDVGMDRNKPHISTVANNHFRYFPSEGDRISDGRRVDHVPALVLIDIAMLIERMTCQDSVYSNISAEFLNYTDPRLEFDILLKKDRGTVEFVQNGQLVAIVHNRDYPGSVERG